MGSPINPVLSGLLNGFSLAHQIKQEQIQQTLLERQKQRDEEETQLRDLQTRLALNDRGYKPSTPDQDAEAITGQGFKDQPLPGAIGTFRQPAPSDIKNRMVKYGGESFVRPSEAEQESVNQRASKKALDDKLTEARALGDLKTQQAVERVSKQLEATGFTVDEEMGKVLHLKPGQKFPAEKLDDLMRAYTTKVKADKPVEPKVQSSHMSYTDQGVGSLTSIMNNGEIRQSDPLGVIGKTKTAPAGQTITPYQQIQLDRQKAADEEKKRGAVSKELGGLKTELGKIEAEEYGSTRAGERGLHTQRLAIGSYLKNGKDAKGNKIDAATREQLTAQFGVLTNRMNQLLTRKQQIQARRAELLRGAPATTTGEGDGGSDRAGGTPLTNPY